MPKACGTRCACNGWSIRTHRLGHSERSQTRYVVLAFPWSMDVPADICFAWTECQLLDLVHTVVMCLMQTRTPGECRDDCSRHGIVYFMKVQSKFAVAQDRHTAPISATGKTINCLCSTAVTFDSPGNTSPTAAPSTRIQCRIHLSKMELLSG